MHRTRRMNPKFRIPPTPTNSRATRPRRCARHPDSSGRFDRHEFPEQGLAEFHLDDWRDLAPAVGRVRSLLDLDADPVAVDGALGDDPALSPLVAARRPPVVGAPRVPVWA